jgi:hypothetical protein
MSAICGVMVTEWSSEVVALPSTAVGASLTGFTVIVTSPVSCTPSAATV